ncbi:2-polyprenyl-3-methyl-6-methoxy-1,4-benzoquinone monooxygenase [Nitrosomonas sp.]|uniref:2-polyprenyl-3-methyl-6-methoxy-1,4-benzoquinone monooxygenase n=1 Tax=Nitrosomonas sp. TaxID=42353 RepID=UPI001D534787|nr:2-polyprenyl-3-methyl-6-methoxy-1,4-benzoquinone monooxygenase [Nitrosomonas sp.]MCB1948264.1 2-polyprenyl-3-methyl-6-methoxy-1,4-benzoquinone monooxygenase [Nitrosomonas sp.]MCP5243394.1 2-polyprenyl-3-methyl-6-methoxy-1,4-benzoquinone monooxygenase [Burkholderiales bacterium]MDR4514836.1 2-polyprenyl-3-methyl-6-methoxy-1,4-benzoquinone monooxygenase [Nitrosomonas sp.]
MMNIDKLIIGFDSALRTLLTPAHTARPVPGSDIPEPDLTVSEKDLSAALMRVNHVGEVCAQALYQGQGLTARNQAVQQTLMKAAREETEHLAWTERRIDELGGRKSLLNPLWYGGSFAIGMLAGVMGDKWNLGFLAETEKQVGEHLSGHLQRLPQHDVKSRAIVAQMQIDEASHATMALSNGGAELPLPVKFAMKLSSKVMTQTAYWV